MNKEGIDKLTTNPQMDFVSGNVCTSAIHNKYTCCVLAKVHNATFSEIMQNSFIHLYCMVAGLSVGPE
jgi:hypothetical protein